jgi:hypothetical protein
MDTHSHLVALIRELSRLPGQGSRLGELSSHHRLPKRGVYFFFEDGEVASGSDGNLRVVRVGTHAVSNGSRSTLEPALTGASRDTSGGREPSRVDFPLARGAGASGKTPAIRSDMGARKHGDSRDPGCRARTRRAGIENNLRYASALARRRGRCGTRKRESNH